MFLLSNKAQKQQKLFLSICTKIKKVKKVLNKIIKGTIMCFAF